ncbi:MAG TPA: glycosyltransferase [Candidatus Krumholzibacteria bacterium]
MSQQRPGVTFVIDDLGYGGTQRQLHLQARALSGRIAMRVASLSAQVEPYAARLREQGIDVAVLPRRSSLDAGRVRALVDYLRAGDHGIVHGMLEASNAYAFVAARTLRLPLVLSLRNSILTVTGAKAAALQWMYRHADAVTVNSVAGRETLVGPVGVAPDRVHLVPNIVPVPASRPALDPAPGPLLGAIGRLTDQKRFHAVIEALPAVRRVFPGARLEILGEGPLHDELEAGARRHGVEDAVELAGVVADPAPRMTRYACLVIASAHEGVPNVALEALAIGLPVVGVPVGDIPRLVSDGVTGVMARDGSPAALAEAITTALSSPSLRATALGAGPALVREHYSEAAARDRLLGVYDALRDGGKKTPGAITGG